MGGETVGPRAQAPMACVGFGCSPCCGPCALTVARSQWLSLTNSSYVDAQEPVLGRGWVGVGTVAAVHPGAPPLLGMPSLLVLSVLLLRTPAVLSLRGCGLDLPSGVTVTLETGDSCEGLCNLPAS